MLAQGLVRLPGKPEVELYKYTLGTFKYEVKAEFVKYKKGVEVLEATTVSVYKNSILESSESIVENSKGIAIASTFAKSSSYDLATCILGGTNPNMGACYDAKSCANKSKQITNKKDRRKFFIKNCLGFCIKCGVNMVTILTCVLNSI